MVTGRRDPSVAHVSLRIPHRTVVDARITVTPRNSGRMESGSGFRLRGRKREKRGGSSGGDGEEFFHSNLVLW